jgi:hypothetical protein
VPNRHARALSSLVPARSYRSSLVPSHRLCSPNAPSRISMACSSHV